MRWVEQEATINRALSVLNKSISNVGKPHSRHHKDGLVRKQTLRDALTKPHCRTCRYLEVTIIETGPSPVALNCGGGKDPLTLQKDFYDNLGINTECEGYQIFPGLEE